MVLAGEQPVILTCVGEKPRRFSRSSSHYRQLAYRAVQIEWVGTEPDGNSPSFPGDVGDAQSPQLHDPSAVEQHEHAGETSPRVDGPFV